jgi:hypothetical protein
MTTTGTVTGVSNPDHPVAIASPQGRANTEGMAEQTVRQVIEALTEAASSLPQGLDSVIELGICDGHDLQLIDEMDVDFRLYVRSLEQPLVPERGTVLIRGHWHRGESPGGIQRGVASDVDEELRRLTGDS